MIFTENLKNKYPFATRFFETALMGKENRFAHAFMLCGADITAQYEMALSIAKHLNSGPTGNSSWIDNNAHPAVITISPIDYSEKSRAIISVDQIRELRKLLSVTSTYHRVIIFTDAKEEYGDLPFAPPKLATKDERDWTPYPLNSKVFAKSPANALLKVLEEPPSNVTYFFLTNNKEEMLPTIVSRCQILPVLSGKLEQQDTSTVQKYVDAIPPKDEAMALAMAQSLLELAKENDVEKLLDAMQEGVRNQLVANVKNKVLVEHFTRILKKLEESKVQLKSFISPQNVIENLFLGLV